MKENNIFKYWAGFLAFILGVNSCHAFLRLRGNPESKDESCGIERRIESKEKDVPHFLKRTDSIYEIIDKYALPEEREFYRAIIKVESSDNPRAASRAGARGLMQIMESTWKDMTNLPYEAAFELEQNIEVGIKYLNWIASYIERNMGSEKWGKLQGEERKRLVLAGYNGGVGRLKSNEWRIEKMPQETRNYVEKVIREMKKLKNK